jgi:hypothetical protein
MGGFFDESFLPTMKKLVEAGLSYDEVKRLLTIPATWEAKITGGQFDDHVKGFFGGAKKRQSSRRKGSSQVALARPTVAHTNPNGGGYLTSPVTPTKAFSNNSTAMNAGPENGDFSRSASFAENPNRG